MRQAVALLLVAIAYAGDGHDHDNHAGHADERQEVDIVKNADYHMNLVYFIEADAFGDKWLNFESTLERE